MATGECHNLIEPPVVKTGSPDAYDASAYQHGSPLKEEYEELLGLSFEEWEWFFGKPKTTQSPASEARPCADSSANRGAMRDEE